MKVAQNINEFFDIIEMDRRLSVWHIALLTALYIMAIRQKRHTQVKVSRRNLMTLSHVSSLPTYHKYFKELQELGYICYRPSYHPGVQSQVDLKQPNI
ncbi:MAG: hypothetical protein CMP77_00725 [Flavobacterium sp.]|nr:hypothetical protein [Flavobacterium sp.]|tara:strand:- start:29923 stop:30216 length:294 start_codon:yes stop_codon:yes gene_type:complete